ncbi:hypothetical protein HDU85_001715 [Gaertneriomyces sp. JEL0708]|nr:hypothetical protein HDU85_001715 [Gaertneriomyces sp. JEL0708]
MTLPRNLARTGSMESKMNQSRVGLRQILKDAAPAPYTLQAFENFLRSEHTLENLEFWTAAQAFREESKAIHAKYTANNSRMSICTVDSSKEPSGRGSVNQLGSYARLTQGADKPWVSDELTDAEREKLREMLEQILERFFTEESDLELNLPQKVRKQLETDIREHGIVAPNVLDVPIIKVYEMLKTQSYIRFLKLAGNVGTTPQAPKLSVARPRSETLPGASAAPVIHNVADLRRQSDSTVNRDSPRRKGSIFERFSKKKMEVMV